MPIAADPELAERLARQLVDLYGAAAEQQALNVARALDDTVDDLGTSVAAQQRLGALERLRVASEQIVADLNAHLEPTAEQVLNLAAQRGGAEALRELGRLGRLSPAELARIRSRLPGAEAVQRLAGSLVTGLRGTHLQLTRWPQDVYREVTSRAAADIALGVSTRRQAAQRIWEDFAHRGVTGFVDRSGRAWALESYVDMASRTVVAQAAVEAHLDRLGDAGIDLVIVSNAPQECERCRPWEGKVLTRTGTGARTVEVEHATRDGVMVPVRVAGSVDDAVAAGFMHPNCRHSLSAFLPGITSQPARTADPEGDAARQKLRRLERGVRRQKLLEQAALTPAAAAQARARVRALQAQIRQHIAATGLHRQRYREQLRLGLRAPSGPPRPRPTPRPRPPSPPPRVTLGTTSLPLPLTPAQRVARGDFTGLRRVGSQRGSNPGGLYEAADGSRWYVKEMAEDRARSEALAAALYQAAGVRAPQIVIGRGAPDLPGTGGVQVASRIVDDAHRVTSPDQVRDQMREGFAVDAWLANWDVAGASWDNVILSGGNVWRIDAGGSLRFRAQGSPKGAAFGDRVNEWITLRDPNKAPVASQAFRGMTPAELVTALERLERVTPDEIRRLVATHGLDDDLAELLIRRREDLLARLPALREAAERHAAFERARAGAAVDHAALNAAIRRYDANRDRITPRPRGWSEDRLASSQRSARWYQGSGYDAMNTALRQGRADAHAAAIEALDDVLSASRLRQPIVAYRGFGRPEQFIAGWNDADVTGLTWTDAGFLSVSADRRIAERFAGAGGVVIRMVTRPRQNGLRLSNMAPHNRTPSGIQQEAEIVLPRGNTLRVVADHGVDAFGRRILDVEIV